MAKGTPTKGNNQPRRPTGGQAPPGPANPGAGSTTTRQVASSSGTADEKTPAPSVATPGLGPARSGSGVVQSPGLGTAPQSQAIRGTSPDQTPPPDAGPGGNPALIPARAAPGLPPPAAPTAPNQLKNPISGPVTTGNTPGQDIGGGPGGTFAIPGTGSREDTRRAAGQFSQTSQNQIMTQIMNILGLQSGALDKSNQSFNAASSGFKSGQDTGYFGQDQLNQIRLLLSNLTQTGGYDPNQVNAIRNTFSGIQNNLKDTYNTDTGFEGTSGAFDPTQLKSVLGGYQNFADTGGFSDQQRQQYLEQATSGVPAIYNTLKQQQQQHQAATGGLGTGGDVAQLARQLSQAQIGAEQKGQVDLNTQINTNKLAGLGGLSTTDAAVAASRQKAAEDASATQGLASSANTAAGGFESDIASGLRSAAQTDVGFESTVASNKAAATAGQAGLYNTATQQVTALGQQILDALGIDSSNQQLALKVLAALADQQGAGPIGILNAISNFIPGASGGARTGASIAAGTP